MKDSRSRRLADWLDDRLALSELGRMFLDEPIPGGARWWYALGAVLAFLVLLEGITGALLAVYYAPSAQTAWASTAFIQDTLTLGWFVRGLHSFGSTALITLAGLHLLQVLVFGAYRAPRELNWLVGLAMLGILVAFALSGYGLPWDEKGYWAKQVETSIMGTTPLIGHALQVLMQGGETYGNYTVTRFFALHAFALPALLTLLVVLHVWLFRRQGPTPRWGVPEAELAKRAQPYFPYQAARNATACGVAILVLALVVIKTHGAALEGPADPTGSYQARPEWYSLALYQLRHYFTGSLEMIATMVLPGLAAVALAALPWLDRSPSRQPSRRPAVMAGALLGVVALGVLSYLPLRADAHDPAFQQASAEAAARAALARVLAQKGVPPEGGTAVYRNDPSYEARQIWNDRCAECHSFSGRGAKGGPDFHRYDSRAWIEAFLRQPDGPLFMGPAKLEKGMPPVQASDDDLAALTELIYAETGAPDANQALVAKARDALWSGKDCDTCHDIDGTSENTGPNLKGRGRLAWIEAVIADGGHPLLFGAKNRMPRFSEKLSPEQITMLAKFLVAEAAKN